ncbi:MAG: hypothetical protein R3F61_26450 [Myxococcota bacterium]
MRFSTLMWIPLVLGACKGNDDTDTDVVDCEAYTTKTLGSIAVTDWPAGMAEAQTAYTALDGRWTAEACGETIGVTITTIPDVANIEVIDQGLPAGNPCGCTHDPSNANDGDLSLIAVTTLNLGVENYPHPAFSEENAGNVPNVPVSLFNDSSGNLRVRACINHLVPPVLRLDLTDNLITIRNGDNGVSGNVELTGEGVAPESCTLTNWVRLGDN